MKNSDPYISIIVPVYNEENRLVRGITKILDFLDRQPYASELVIVDDGSTDGTAKLLGKLKHKNVRIVSCRHHGKGYAVRSGMLAGRGEWRVFLDIDLSTPVEHVRKCLPYFGSHDIIIGSRRVKGSKILTHQPFMRERLGAVFTRLSAMILGVDATDFTCGFKCFSRNAAETVFRLQRLKGWSFDSEILYISHKKRLRIKEVPVTWTNDAGTRVRLLKDVWLSFMDLVSIRVCDAAGKYG